MTADKRKAIVKRMAKLWDQDPGAFSDYTMDLFDRFGYSIEINQLANAARKYRKIR